MKFLLELGRYLLGKLKEFVMNILSTRIPGLKIGGPNGLYLATGDQKVLGTGDSRRYGPPALPSNTTQWISPLCITNQPLLFPHFLSQIGNDTHVSKIRNLSVGNQGVCVLEEDKTQRGWLHLPDSSGKIGFSILPFGPLTPPVVNQVKFNDLVIDINPPWNLNKVFINKDRIFQIDATTNTLDILNLQTQTIQSFQLNELDSLPNEYYGRWAHVYGNEAIECIICDNRDSRPEDTSRLKLITIEGDKSTIAPLYTSGRNLGSDGNNHGFIALYEDETTNTLDLILIDAGIKTFKLPNKLSETILGSKFDIAITATGNVLLKVLNDDNYQEFSITTEQLKEATPLRMEHFKNQSIALDTENSHKEIQILDDKHTVIIPCNGDQMFLIKETDTGELQLINLNLPTLRGQIRSSSGRINGDIITINVETDAEEEFSILYSLNQDKYPMATIHRTNTSSPLSPPTSPPSPRHTPPPSPRNNTHAPSSPRHTSPPSPPIDTYTTSTDIGVISTTFHPDNSTTTSAAWGEVSTHPPTSERTTVAHTPSGEVTITTPEGTTTISPNGDISSTPTASIDGSVSASSNPLTTSMSNILQQTNGTVNNIIDARNLTISPVLNQPTTTPPNIDPRDYGHLIKIPDSQSIVVENTTIPTNSTNQTSPKDTDPNFNIHLTVVGSAIVGAVLVCTISGICIKRAINISRISPQNDSAGDVEMGARYTISISNHSNSGFDAPQPS